VEPGKQIVVDFDGTDGQDGILVGEPIYGGMNWWLSEGEQLIKDNAPHTGGGYGSDWYGTLAEWSAKFPSAEVLTVGYSLGSGIHSGGMIESMTFGEITYDFTPALGMCDVTIDDVAMRYTLTQDCETFATIPVNDGWTVDGDGYTLTAVEDATHPNFPGPVLVSATGNEIAPATLNVTDLTINTSFTGTSSGGNLAGIRYNQAGGSITNVEITGITHGNGVQEGHALYIRNKTPGGSLAVPEATVVVDNVTISRYQKSGVIFDGPVDFTMTNSTVGRSTDQAGNPIDNTAANAVQISRGAHGTLSGSTIALNDYNPTPPPGDGSSATGILVYDATDVTISQNVITGTNGDIGMDVSNDGAGGFTTVVNVSCNSFDRNSTAGDYDPYGIGLSQWDGEGTTVNLSDSTFSGWNHDTALLSGSLPELVVEPGAVNAETGACVASAPAVTATGGVEVVDVTWTPAAAPAYAPVTGYEVTLTGSDSSSETQTVDADTTTAHFAGLESGVNYTASVVAINGSGESAAGTATVNGSTLTLTVDKPQVTYNKATFVRGELTGTAGGLAGRTITIEARPQGAPGWTVVGTTTTAADGSYQLSVKPKKHTAYRAQYAGGADTASTSGPATVYVKIKVGFSVSDDTVSQGTTVLFTGKVRPRLKGETVSLERKVAGDWTVIDSKTLKKDSEFKFFWDADTLGSSQFRASVDGTAVLLKGTSKTITMVVS
jgi:hypothetical protein